MARRSEDLHPRSRQPRVAASDCDGVGEWRETERADLFKKKHEYCLLQFSARVRTDGDANSEERFEDSAAGIVLAERFNMASDDIGSQYLKNGECLYIPD